MADIFNFKPVERSEVKLCSDCRWYQPSVRISDAQCTQPTVLQRAAGARDSQCVTQRWTGELCGKEGTLWEPSRRLTRIELLDRVKLLPPEEREQAERMLTLLQRSENASQSPTP